ncbi:hypothetical protein [Amycolatopsis sp. NBC_00438]|uniref:hypothetical protein n=1 Tax=Amycolatopsis sp. NBC_00438 TaxID=2903558 RepID=UPI002E229430
MITRETVDIRLAERLGELPAEAMRVIERTRDMAFGAYRADSAVLTGSLALLLQLGNEWVAHGMQDLTKLEDMFTILEPGLPEADRADLLAAAHNRYHQEKTSYAEWFAGKTADGSVHTDRRALRDFFRTEVYAGFKLTIVLDALDVRHTSDR